MTQEEFTENDLLKYISTFSEKVKGKRKGDFPEGAIDGEYTNRGNKLKAGADLVHRDRIDGFNNASETLETIHYNRVQRVVVKRRRLDSYNYPEDEAEGDDDEDSDGDEEADDPYAGIDLEKVLAPIQQTNDLVTREAISKTYTSNVLRHLAQQAIEIIEKEQDTVIHVSSLLDIMLGDDSSQLLEAKLLLPDFDQPNSDAQQKEGIDDSDKRITRKQSVQEMDPFFALPNIKIDPDFGLDQDDAEEVRQLSQIALQRNEEFIRNLSLLRNGLVRAQYVKEKLYNWAKEINGDPDESDIYQKELAVANAAKEAEKAANNLKKSEDSPSSNSATPVPEVATRRSNRRRRN